MSETTTELTVAQIRDWATDLRNERDCGAQAALLDGIADQIASLRAALAEKDARIAGLEGALQMILEIIDPPGEPGVALSLGASRTRRIKEAARAALSTTPEGDSTDG